MQRELMLNKLICSPCMMVLVPGESSLVLSQPLLSTANKLLP